MLPEQKIWNISNGTGLPDLVGQQQIVLCYGHFNIIHPGHIRYLEHAKSLTGKAKPILNLMSTEMGYGVDFMVGTHKWHGVAPNDEQLADALAQLPETLGDY